jgi:hypothetical protein
MAESLEFLPDAPVNLVELDHPRGPSGVHTLDEFDEWQADRAVALEAFDIRRQTGETPTEFLATLSEQARAMYEDQLIRRARELELWDQDREAMASIPPFDPSEMDKTAYWESERDHCRWLIANDQLLSEEDAHTREFCDWLEQQEDLSNVGTPPTPPSSPESFNFSDEINTANRGGQKDFLNRQGLPARFKSPIHAVASVTGVWCYSHWHTAYDTYAIDIICILKDRAAQTCARI